MRIFTKFFWKDLYGDIFHAWPDNIRRIIDYIPVLWKDWDFQFDIGGYVIIKKKLERLCPSLEDGHTMNGPRHAKQIKKVIAALDRLIEDNYEKEDLARIDEKWGTWEYEFTPDDTGEWLNMGQKFKNKLTDEEKEQHRLETKEAYNIARKKSERDSKFVFDVMSRWHRYWWD